MDVLPLASIQALNPTTNATDVEAVIAFDALIFINLKVMMTLRIN